MHMHVGVCVWGKCSTQHGTPPSYTVHPTLYSVNPIVADAAIQASSVQVIVTVWRANASYVRGVLGSGGLSAVRGPLLGQYVQVFVITSQLARGCIY